MSATVSEWQELMSEKPDGFGVIKNMVCKYCRNKLRHGCIEACAPEGLYRNLEPKELAEWKHLPKLPSMSKLMDYAPVTRFAYMYLALHYLVSQVDLAQDDRSST